MKRLITIAVSLCVIISMFSSCQTKKEVEQTNEELNLYLFKEDKWGIAGKATEIFKEKYPNVKVNIEAYDTEESGRKIYDSFQLDLGTRLMSGKGPDMVFADSAFFENCNLNKMIESNIFEPLNEFIENDKEFNESEYNMDVINLSKQDEVLYYMPLSYSMPFIMYPQSTIEDYKTQIKTGSMTEVFNSLIDYSKEIKEKNLDARLLMDVLLKPSSTIDYNVASIYNFLNLSGLKTLDYTNKKINFDDERIKGLIDQYKILYNADFSKNKYMETLDIVNLDYKNKKSLFGYYCSPPFSFMYLVTGSARLSGYSKPNIMTINTVDNKKTARLQCLAGISRESKNKQNVYNFIKILMSKEVQSNFDIADFTAYIPINKSCVIPNAKKNASGFGGFPTHIVDVIEDSTNDIGNVTFSTPWDLKLYELLVPYLKDEKTYDECMDLIKKQAQIYVSE